MFCFLFFTACEEVFFSSTSGRREHGNIVLLWSSIVQTPRDKTIFFLQECYYNIWYLVLIYFQSEVPSRYNIHHVCHYARYKTVQQNQVRPAGQVVSRRADLARGSSATRCRALVALLCPAQLCSPLLLLITVTLCFETSSLQYYHYYQYHFVHIYMVLYEATQYGACFDMQ